MDAISCELSRCSSMLMANSMIDMPPLDPASRCSITCWRKVMMKKTEGKFELWTGRNRFIDKKKRKMHCVFKGTWNCRKRRQTWNQSRFCNSWEPSHVSKWATWHTSPHTHFLHELHLRRSVSSLLNLRQHASHLRSFLFCSSQKSHVQFPEHSMITSTGLALLLQRDVFWLSFVILRPPREEKEEFIVTERRAVKREEVRVVSGKEPAIFTFLVRRAKIWNFG